MNDQLPIVQFWHSPSRPEHIDELTRSFARLNPDRPHLLFDSESAAAYIAEHFSERETSAFRQCGAPAMQADYFRYCAILHGGGIWADAGYRCVRNLTPLVERPDEGVVFRRTSALGDQILINSFFAFSSPGHPFLRLTLELATKLIEARWEGMVNEVTGPLILTALYRLARAGSVDVLLRELTHETHDLTRVVRYTTAVCELIGATARAQDACENLQVKAPDDRPRWAHYEKLPHRARSDHWERIGTRIYSRDQVQLPLIQYWHDKEIPGEIEELIDTFRERNPNFRHMVFCEAEAEQFIARHLGEREVEAFRACAVPAMQADYFRYCAVFVLGGLCSDADVRCLRRLDDMVELADEGVLFRKPLGQIMNGIFLFKRPGHPLLRLTIDVVNAQIEQRAAENVWEVTGPWTLSALAALHALGSEQAFRRELKAFDIHISLDPLLSAARDRNRLATAFRGVRIVPYARSEDWIRPPGQPLSYRNGPTHWANWQERESIFRFPASLQ